ncbi:MAG TPA: DUF6770 family protein [Chitinophagales bacterium]|nr:DUF6770 family protein [Chitinophagales bacterium]
MKENFLALLIVCFSLSNSFLFAQTYSLENIKKDYTRGSGPIVKNNQVSGYYFFNFIDKKDKKTNNYRLSITDANFQKVASKDISGPLDLLVIDAAYNEDVLAIKLVDYKSKVETQSIKFFDKTAKELKTITLPFDMMAALITNDLYTPDDLETSDLHPIDGIGFINLTSIQTKGGMAKRIGVSIDMIPNAPDYKNWHYETPTKLIEVPEFLGYNDEVAFFSMMRRESYIKGGVKYSITAMDLKTGEIRFDKEFTDESYLLDVISINKDENSDNTFLFGSIIDKDKKLATAKTLGMFIAKIDNDGNIKQKSTFLWSDIAKDFKPVDEKGEPVDIGNIFIHKVITNADGKVYAIGERFYKAASGSGIAMTLLGRGSGGGFVKIVVAELVIIELGKDLKPIAIDLIDKGKNNVNLPTGLGWYGTIVLGPYVKQRGGFDYQFSQIFDDKEGFTTVYKSNEKKDKFINTYTILDDRKTKDKISLKTESSKLYVFPAKAGYLAITEYFKKEKKITSRLEKFKH